MRPINIVIAAAVVSGLAAIALQSASKEQTVRMDAGGAKFITVAAKKY